MPRRTNDRLQALQARAAALVAPTAPSAPELGSDAAALAEVRAHFGAVLAPLVQHHTVHALPIDQIAPVTDPESRQPRLLSLPAELTASSVTDLERAIAAELRVLGESLRARQIQPIVVYPGRNAQFPAAQYLILVGQRRWTAAQLVGLATLDAICIDPPDSAERIRIQYAENEQREEFSDMERAWALIALKQAMGDVPWEQIESRLQLSRARRHQLLRLTAFTPAQQNQVARLRLRETNLRSLHSSIRNQSLAPEQVDSVLERIAEIVTMHSNPQTKQPIRRAGVIGQTVGLLVAQALAAQQPTTEVGPPRWLLPVRRAIKQVNTRLQRATTRSDRLSAADAAQLHSAIQNMLGHLARLTATLPDTPAAGESPDIDSRLT